MVLDPARRAALEETRARSLLTGALALDEPSTVAAIPGALAVRSGGRAHLVLSSDPDTVAHTAMGGALLWAAHQGIDDVVLVAEHDAGVHARRAAVLRPAPEVHEVHGTGVRPAEPTPLDAPVEIDPAALVARPTLEAAGLEVVIEHGVMTGEVAGLEVARVLVHDGEAEIQVGVGRYDQAAAAVLHADRPVGETLDRVAATIRAGRRPGGGADAVGRLCRARWLRAHLVEHPELLGLDTVEPVEPPIPREGLRDELPAPAIGDDPDGGRVLVLTSVGVDPSVVPLAADLVLRHGVDRVIVVVPPRDERPLTTRMAEWLPGGAPRAVTPPWDHREPGRAVD